jgi:magnesium chelatase family protein
LGRRSLRPLPVSAGGDQRYRSRLSGPLLDRIDLQLAVPRLAPHELRSDAPRGESTAMVRARVLAARQRQRERGALNARLNQAQADLHCRLAAREQALLERAMESLQLSARAAHRLLRLARTIADLDAAGAIGPAHLAEALAYRELDRGSRTLAA